jgi:hypothetical protein
MGTCPRTAGGSTRSLPPAHPSARHRQHAQNIVGCEVGFAARRRRLQMLRQRRFRHWTELSVRALPRLRPKICAENQNIFDLFCEARHRLLLKRVRLLAQTLRSRGGRCAEQDLMQLSPVRFKRSDCATDHRRSVLRRVRFRHSWIYTLTCAGNLQSRTSDRRHVFLRPTLETPKRFSLILAKYRRRAIINLAAKSHVDHCIHGQERSTSHSVPGGKHVVLVCAGSRRRHLLATRRIHREASGQFLFGANTCLTYMNSQSA